MASIAITSSNYGDSSWQLVNSQRLGRTGKHEAQVPSIRQRRGHTDANKRLSLLKMRSRSNTSLGHLPSPSLLTNSQRAGHDDTEEARLESGWSDSDHSDSPTKSWVAKGSKMLKKQNSKFSLSSSRRSTWVEETDEVNKQHPEVPLRNSNKHGRMYSTGSSKLLPSCALYVMLTDNLRSPCPSRYQYLQTLQFPASHPHASASIHGSASCKPTQADIGLLRNTCCARATDGPTRYPNRRCQVPQFTTFSPCISRAGNTSVA